MSNELKQRFEHILSEPTFEHSHVREKKSESKGVDKQFIISCTLLICIIVLLYKQFMCTENEGIPDVMFDVEEAELPSGNLLSEHLNPSVTKKIMDPLFQEF